MKLTLLATPLLALCLALSSPTIHAEPEDQPLPGKKKAPIVHQKKGKRQLKAHPAPSVKKQKLKRDKKTTQRQQSAAKRPGKAKIDKTKKNKKIAKSKPKSVKKRH